MELVKEDIKSRILEIEKYLKAIEKIENPKYALYKVDGTTKRKDNFDSELPKIMKATFFLLLYNLVESTIRLSFTELYEKIEEKQKPIAFFKNHYTEIWIKQQFLKKDPISSNQSTYRNLISKMIESILQSENFSLSSESLPLSGNLDARKMRELLGIHGINQNIHYRAKGGAELLTVKSKRNELAHGNISFGQCGQEYTSSDLLRIKKETVTFLKSIVRNIEKYITRADYAA